MGCFIEFVLEIILEGWVKLMMLIIPEKGLGNKAHKTVTVFVIVFSVLLLFAMFLGLIAMVSDDAYTKQFGRYLFFISLSLSVLQIIVGVIAKCIQKKN